MKYFYSGKFDPKKLHPLNIDAQSVSLVPEKSRILEIGCANGFMGEYLTREKKCQVAGVEKEREAAREAKHKGLEVIAGDIEEERTLQELAKKERFNIILAQALIEHLKDPWQALKNWKKFLKNDGFLIITTSNIAHWSARLKILWGKFEYEDYGLFDITHLHFFTIESFKKLIKDCGYKIEYISFDPVGGGFPKISQFLVKFWPGLFAYQIVICAKPI